MKLDILAFAAHPDDIELGCSGTLLKHIHQGKKVGIVDLTRGELGTRGTAELRSKESEAATGIMNISVRENLEFADGFFKNDKDHQMAVIQVIRKYRPEIVIANAISDRHPDHGKAAQLVADSCFLSGLKKIVTKPVTEPQMEWRPRAVYNYIQDRYIKPDFIIDITDFIDIKLEVIKAYKSQFFNPDSTEPITPISTPEFMEFIVSRARDYGRLIGVTYGEGFTAPRTIGVHNFDSIY